MLNGMHFIQAGAFFGNSIAMASQNLIEENYKLFTVAEH